MEGDRTLDLRIANATLSQLSYHPDTANAQFYRIRALRLNGKANQEEGSGVPRTAIISVAMVLSSSLAAL